MLWFTKRITMIAFLRRNAGFLFLFCVLVLFFDIGLRSGRKSRSQTDSDSEDGKDDSLSSGKESDAIIQHPIPRLMEKSEDVFRMKLRRQNETLKEAVKEYRRRYKRPPPKGFDDWWRFAQKH